MNKNVCLSLKSNSKFTLRCSRGRFFSFVALLFMLCCFLFFFVSVISTDSFFAAGAETPIKVVKTEIELVNAIKIAPDDKSPYVIGLSEDITLKNSLEIPNDKNINLVSVDGFWKLYGTNKQYTITVAGSLTLDGICVTHKNGNTGGGVYVKNGGALVLLSGKISDNTCATDGSARGGGVFVDSGGSFVMSGGTISGNTASRGGGVCNRGTFTLLGGEISGNTADSDGGGVYVGGFGCGFVMSGGKISNNKAPIGGGVYNGGGGFLHGGVTAGVTFTMTGGEITGNTAETFCGGLYYVEGSFDRQGGVISGNTAGIDNNDVGNWAIDFDPIRHSNGNSGVSDEIDVPDGGDFGVAGDGGEADVPPAEKIKASHMLLPIIVVAVGIVAGGLLFYRSKKPKQPSTKGLIRSDVV